MNAETLLHAAAEQLRNEATKGPGTMFLLIENKTLYVTRTPGQVSIRDVVAQYRCEKFNKGLTSTQWASLLKKLWTAHLEAEKGDASAKND